MKALLLTVLLTVSQTPAPILRQAPNSATSTSQNVPKKTQSDKAFPANTPPALNQNTPPIHNESGDKQGNKDAENSVVISKPIAVTVTPAQRDWFDLGVWFFNFLLVIVGILQWRVLRKQNKLMGAHAGHLENLAAATKNQADFLINKERARISVERLYEGFFQGYVEKNPVVETGIKIIQDGPTHAYTVRGEYSIIIDISNDPPPISDGVWEMQIPSVIKCGQEPIIVSAIIPDNITDSFIERLNNKDIFLHFFGRISYTDVSGMRRETTFRYMWEHSEPESSNGWVDDSGWVKYGPEEDNREA